MKSPLRHAFQTLLVDVIDGCPEDAGGWNEEGTVFVADRPRFSRVLAVLFGVRSWNTFARQLNMYGFSVTSIQKPPTVAFRREDVRRDTYRTVELKRKKKYAGRAKKPGMFGCHLESRVVLPEAMAEMVKRDMLTPIWVQEEFDEGGMHCSRYET